MGRRIEKLYNKFGIKSDRTKNITKHVLLSFIYKGGSILASFMIVPLTINFLEIENYGIWLTLSSFIAWFSFFDIGLGNGLRNKFAEAKANGDLTLAKAFVSSAYFTIGAVSIGLIILFVGLNFFIDWTKVFNTSPSLHKDLGLLMPIVFGFFCLQLVVKLITTIYTADQHHSTQGKITFLTNLGSLLIVWLLTKTTNSSLLIFGVIYSVFPTLLLVGFNFFAFKGRYNYCKPNYKYWKKEHLKDIFGLGSKFFIIQISWVVITSTDNIIISQLFSPEDVVQYNLSLKLFTISSMIFAILATPYWSTFTEAHVKADTIWIKGAMKSLERFVILFSILCLVILFLSKYILNFWLGPSVFIPFEINLAVCIMTIFIIVLTPYNYYINATGKIKIQLYLSLLMALINIPLSIYIAKSLDFGVVGVMISTIICIAPGIVFSRIQFKKIISETAKGIWNQ